VQEKKIIRKILGILSLHEKKYNTTDSELLQSTIAFFLVFTLRLRPSKLMSMAKAES